MFVLAKMQVTNQSKRQEAAFGNVRPENCCRSCGFQAGEQGQGSLHGRIGKGAATLGRT